MNETRSRRNAVFVLVIVAITILGLATFHWTRMLACYHVYRLEKIGFGPRVASYPEHYIIDVTFHNTNGYGLCDFGTIRFAVPGYSFREWSVRIVLPALDAHAPYIPYESKDFSIAFKDGNFVGRIVNLDFTIVNPNVIKFEDKVLKLTDNDEKRLVLVSRQGEVLAVKEVN